MNEDRRAALRAAVDCQPRGRDLRFLADGVLSARRLARKLDRSLTRDRPPNVDHALAHDLAADLKRAYRIAWCMDPSRHGRSMPIWDRTIAYGCRESQEIGPLLVEAHDIAFRLADELVCSDDDIRLLASELADAFPSLINLVSTVAIGFERAFSHISRASYDGVTAEEFLRELMVRRRAPAAGQVLALAAKLIPSVYRDRYSQEFRAELWEIADAGAPHRQQIKYAIRQLIRVSYIRRELLAAPTRNALR